MHDDDLIKGQIGVQFCGTACDGRRGLQGVQYGRGDRVSGVGLVAKLISDR
ncbi:hypothetical protein E3A20_23040, partial [Planctomyces bekefii]